MWVERLKASQVYSIQLDLGEGDVASYGRGDSGR